MYKGRVSFPLFWIIWVSFILISALSIAISTWMNMRNTEAMFINNTYSRTLDRIEFSAERWTVLPHTEYNFRKLTLPLHFLDGTLINNTQESLPLDYAIVSTKTHKINYQTVSQAVGYKIYSPNYALFKGKQSGFIEVYTPLFKTQSFLVWDHINAHQLWVVNTSVTGLQLIIQQSVIHNGIVIALYTFSLVTILSFFFSQRATTLLYQLLSISKFASKEKQEVRKKRTWIKEFDDISRLMWEHQTLVKHLTERDALTGAYNRYALERTMEQHFSLLKDMPTVFVLFDLDHFKELNDTQGHQKGDEALQALTHYLTNLLSDKDVIARLGGDEFVLLLFHTEWTPALEQKLITWVHHSPLASYHLKISMGIVELPSEAEDFPAVYRLADQRLYAAKRAGRNMLTPPHDAPMVSFTSKTHHQDA